MEVVDEPDEGRTGSFHGRLKTFCALAGDQSVCRKVRVTVQYTAAEYLPSRPVTSFCTNTPLKNAEAMFSIIIGGTSITDNENDVVYGRQS